MLRECVILSALVILSSCSNKVTADSYKDKKISEILEDGFAKLDKKSYDDAVIAFKTIDDLYPYSATASSAQVFAAYSLYMDKKYQDAVRELELFMKYNPTHELYSYAMYLRGVCFLKQVCKIGRSQQDTIRAKLIFIDLINRFPESDYAKEADKMIIKLDNALAASEMNVAKYYQFTQHNLNAALSRYSVVATNFSYSNQTPEALYRMVECYSSLSLDKQAENAYKELHRLFPESKWAMKSLKVFGSKFSI